MAETRVPISSLMFNGHLKHVWAACRFAFKLGVTVTVLGYALDAWVVSEVRLLNQNLVNVHQDFALMFAYLDQVDGHEGQIRDLETRMYDREAMRQRRFQDLLRNPLP